MSKELGISGELGKSFILFLSLIILGAFYDMGFWSQFGINFFDYMTSIDLLKSAAIPITNHFIQMLLYLFIGIYSNRFVIKRFVMQISKIEKDKKPNAFRVWAIYFALGLISLIILLILEKHFYFWILMPFTMLCFFSAIIAVVTENDQADSAEKPKTRKPRASVVFCILAFLLLFCYSSGKVDALRIYENRNFNYLNQSDVPQINVSNAKIKFVGKMGEYIFLSSMDNNQIFIFKEDSLLPLKLGHIKGGSKLMSWVQ